MEAQATRQALIELREAQQGILADAEGVVALEGGRMAVPRDQLKKVAHGNATAVETAKFTHSITRS